MKPCAAAILVAAATLVVLQAPHPVDAGGLQRASIDLGPDFAADLIARNKPILTLPYTTKDVSAKLAKERVLAAMNGKSSGVADLGLGKSYAQLDQVFALLKQIHDILGQQDQADDEFLRDKLHNKTHRYQLSVDANKTLADTSYTLGILQTNLSTSESELSAAQDYEAKFLATSVIERRHIDDMKTALRSLKNEDIQGIQMLAKQLGNIVNPTALIGRAYTDQVSLIDGGITALENTIDANDEDTKKTTEAKQATYNNTKALHQGVSHALNIAKSLQQSATVMMFATDADYEAAKVIIENTKNVTQNMRQLILSANASATEILNKQWYTTALQAGRATDKSILDAKSKILSAMTQITFAMFLANTAETTDRNNKNNAYKAISALTPNVLANFSAAKSDLDGMEQQVSTAFTQMNDALKAKQDEDQAQQREEAALKQLALIVEGLNVNQTASNLQFWDKGASSSPSFVHLQAKAMRDHNDFKAQFNGIIQDRRTSMKETITRMENELGTKTERHRKLNEEDLPPFQQKYNDELQKKTFHLTDEATKLREFDSADQKLIFNSAIREQEKAAVNQITNYFKQIS